MTKFKDKNVLITGGASGIGKIMAKKILAKKARNIILWDIDEKKLADFKNEEKDSTDRIYTYKIDLSKLEQIKTTSLKTKEEVGNIDIIINNAGIVVGKDFKDHSYEDIEATMQINTIALMHVTKSFIDDIIKNGEGHICNIASAAGLVANPKMSVYAASKWAVIGWSESLRIELENLNKKIRVTTVCPYYINTGMFDGVKSNFLLPILNPNKVATRIIKSIEKNKIMLKTPFLIKLTPFVRGILPIRWFDWFGGKVLGVYKTMETFKGHQK